jgi:NDP-sugar pyrophosphorylase family protein
VHGRPASCYIRCRVAIWRFIVCADVGGINMNIIITMAGEGARFQKQGISVPKPMIMVNGRTLFTWALTSLANFFHNKFFFIVRKSHNACDFVREECGLLGIKSLAIKELDRLTPGQAATVLEAESLLGDKGEEVLIYNIDTYVEPEELHPRMVRGEGWVPVFEAAGEHWSFVKMSERGRVCEMTEKIRISPYGSIGLYYFQSFDLFKYAYSEYYRSANGQEQYIAPIYNVLLREQKEIFSDVLNEKHIHVLGTPEEVEVFKKKSIW